MYVIHFVEYSDHVRYLADFAQRRLSIDGVVLQYPFMGGYLGADSAIVRVAQRDVLKGRG